MNLNEATPAQLAARLAELLEEGQDLQREEEAARLERELREGTWFTVVGSWVENGERWGNHYLARHWRQAEELAMMDVGQAWIAAGMTGEPRFMIAHTFEGKLPWVDTATYSDHDETL